MNDTLSTNHSDERTGYLVSGLVLVTMGVLFLLDEFHVANFGSLIRRYWPLFIIIVALPKLFRRDAFWSGLWMLTLGIWFQLVTLRMLGLTWRNSWPLILIALGGGIILRTLIESANRPRGRHEI